MSLGERISKWTKPLWRRWGGGELFKILKNSVFHVYDYIFTIKFTLMDIGGGQLSVFFTSCPSPSFPYIRTIWIPLDHLLHNSVPSFKWGPRTWHISVQSYLSNFTCLLNLVNFWVYIYKHFREHHAQVQLPNVYLTVQHSQMSHSVTTVWDKPSYWALSAMLLHVQWSVCRSFRSKLKHLCNFRGVHVSRWVNCCNLVISSAASWCIVKYTNLTCTWCVSKLAQPCSIMYGKQIHLIKVTILCHCEHVSMLMLAFKPTKKSVIFCSPHCGWKVVWGFSVHINICNRQNHKMASNGSSGIVQVLGSWRKKQISVDERV